MNQGSGMVPRAEWIRSGQIRCESALIAGTDPGNSPPRTTQSEPERCVRDRVQMTRDTPAETTLTYL
jgi:hypothetical protein